MLSRFVVLGLCCCVLGNCVAANKVGMSGKDNVFQSVVMERTASTLESWWSLFNDPVIDRLVSSAVNLNMPAQKPSDNLLDTDVSYSALSRFYSDPKATLIVDVTQNYMRYRYVQNQQRILNAYLADRNEIITAFVKGRKSAADPHLMRIKSATDTLAKKSISLDRQKDEVLRDITNLTKLLPEYVSQILKPQVSIPRADIMPVLASPASMIAMSPDVVAARFYFMQKMNGSVQFSDTDNVFPDMAMNGFYGVSDDVYVNNNAQWSVSVGHAVKAINLQNLEELYAGQDIYNDFRNHFFDAVMNLERLIMSYAYIQEQYIVLRNAAVSTERDYTVMASSDSDPIVLLQARKEAYVAETAALHAEHEKVKLLIEVYEKLGVY